MKDTWLAGLNDAFKAAIDGAPLDQSLGILIATALKQLDSTARCAFYIADETGEALSHVIGMPAAYAQAVNGFKIGADSLACGLAVGSGQSVITPDVREEPKWKPWLWLAEQLNYRACWSFPVETTTGELVGTFATYFVEPRTPSADDLALAKTLTRTASIIIVQHRALEESKRLQFISTELIQEGNVDHLYDEILNALAVMIRCKAASLQMLEPAASQLILLAARGFDDAAKATWSRVTAESSTVCGAALRSGIRAVVSDLDDPLFVTTEANRETYRRLGIRAVLTTPLVSRSGQVLGMMSSLWGIPHTPTERELRLVDILGRQTADLIERVQTRRRLEENEERLRQFGEASQDILWIRDATRLQWQYLTPAFEQIYGVSRTEAMMGDNYRSWLDLVIDEDRDRARAAMDRVRAGEHVTFDYRIKRPSDGGIRWIRNTDFPIANESGVVTFIGGIGHDMTELRETELRLQTLMQGIPQLVWRAVDGGEWTWSSPQWTNYTGRSLKDSIGFGWLAALHLDDRDRALQCWERAMDAGALEFEGRIYHAAQDEYRWFQTRATPVRSESGFIIEWLGTSTDVHQLREMQDRQKVLVAELQHRTRNLMGIVRAMAEKTLRSSENLDDFRDHFRDRLDALARVQGLLSRLDERDRVTFDELIRTEIEAMTDATDRVTLQGPADVPLRSSTVQTLAMAIHELATNAVKYGALSQPQGHLDVKWEFQPRGQGGIPWLHVDWRERNVEIPASIVAARSGDGRELIERALPYQLSAKTSYNIETDGVHCTISMPVSAAGQERHFA
ncbi:MAG TPA: PAS domain-containing protein [Steroidobacteraceae bacterium]|nr:PAS domain-containing protein [Steroidobacteraceae bacterium]